MIANRVNNVAIYLFVSSGGFDLRFLLLLIVLWLRNTLLNLCSNALNISLCFCDSFDLLHPFITAELLQLL